MRPISLIVIVFVLFVNPAYSDEKGSRCLDEVCFTKTLDLKSASGEVSLSLNAAILYRFWGFRVYNVALYQPGKLDKEWQKEPLALVLHYFRTLDPEDFLKTSRKYLANDPAYKARNDETSLLAFQKFITQVKDGDRYTVLYFPDGRLSLFLNGKLQGEVKDEIFAKAYIGMWLGEDSVKDSNRDRLLSGVFDD